MPTELDAIIDADPQLRGLRGRIDAYEDAEERAIDRREAAAQARYDDGDGYFDTAGDSAGMAWSALQDEVETLRALLQAAARHRRAGQGAEAADAVRRLEDRLGGGGPSADDLDLGALPEPSLGELASELARDLTGWLGDSVGEAWAQLRALAAPGEGRAAPAEAPPPVVDVEPAARLGLAPIWTLPEVAWTRLSADGAQVIHGLEGQLRVQDLIGQEVVHDHEVDLRGHRAAAVSPGGAGLYVLDVGDPSAVSPDVDLVLVDPSTGFEQARIPLPSAPRQGVLQGDPWGAVAVSSSGDLVAASFRGRLHVFDPDLSAPRHPPLSLAGASLSLAAAPSAPAALARSAGALEVVDLEAGKVVLRLTPDEDEVSAATLDGEGRVWVAFRNPDELRAFGPDGEVVRSLDLDEPVHRLRCFDGTHLVAAAGGPQGEADSHLQLRDAGTGELLRRVQDLPREPGELAWVDDLAASADGARVLVRCGPVVTAWEASTGLSADGVVGPRMPVTDAALSGDGQLVVAALLDGTVRAYRLPEGTERWRYRPEGGAWSRGRALVVFRRDGAEHVAIRGWSTGRWGVPLAGSGPRTAEPLTPLGHPHWFVGRSRDGGLRVVNVHDGPLRVEDADHPGAGQVLEEETPLSELAFFPDGVLLAGRLDGRTLGIWSARTAQRILTYELEGFEYADLVQPLAVAPSGDLVVLGRGPGSLVFLDLHRVAPGPTQAVVRVTGRADLRIQETPVQGLSFSADGRRLALCEAGRAEVRVYEVAALRAAAG